MTDPNGHNTGYTWDNAQRPTTVTDALGQHVDSHYDTNSNVDTLTTGAMPPLPAGTTPPTTRPAPS